MLLLCGCELGTDRVYMEMYTAMNVNSEAIEISIDERIRAMKDAVKRKRDYKVLVPTAEEIEQITKDFNAFVYDIDEHLNNKNLKAINDDEIKGNIIAHRRKIINAIKKLSEVRHLRIKDDAIQELIELHIFPNGTLPPINGKPFDDYSFESQSIACNKAILAKQKNDALMIERITVNYLSGQIGHTATIFDRPVVVSAPKAPFIIKGETFETQIFLSFPSQVRQHNHIIKVNDIELPVKDGIATYTTTPTTYGEHIYDVEITLTNPHSGKQATWYRPFSFEVGERCY